MTGSGKDCESSMAHITNLALRKGATFHSPISSPTDTFVPPQLSRSQSHLDDVVNARHRRIALALNDVDEALAKTANLTLSPKPSNNKPLRDTSLPIPRGLFPELPVVMGGADTGRRAIHPRPVRHSHAHASDSGLGSSVPSTDKKRQATQAIAKNGKTNTLSTASALTSSGAANAKQKLAPMSRKALSHVHEHILRPLQQQPSFKDFEPLVLDVPRRIRSKEIICLRDLEKTLLFMAPVSRLCNVDGVWTVTHWFLLSKETAKSATLYLEFCLTSIQCIQATVEYLSDREQVRIGDRPYTNGYFIDLKDQIIEYGRQLACNEKGVDKYVPLLVSPTDFADNVQRDDEIRLFGGIAENGRPAQLVRVQKDGTAISMATGERVDLADSPVQFKRSLSAQREDEEEIMRSMARRKKNPTAEELAPRKCREPGCDKEFKRHCDLSKHEKTHSRPWKCPIVTCKYHSLGWPTQKEMDRHVNDKHSDAPAMYECSFKPCGYSSKRESNCKQHMEKAHGWTYVRTKSNGKKKALGTPDAAAAAAAGTLPTPPTASIDTPNNSEWRVSPPAMGQMNVDFPAYQPEEEWLASLGLRGSEPADGMDISLDETSPSSSSLSYEQFAPYQNGSTFILNENEDLYAATVQVPSLPLAAPAHIMNKFAPPPPSLYQTEARMPCLIPQVPVPAHFSPVGQENAMLFTPTSLHQVDEGFDDSLRNDGSDFQLFPPAVINESTMQQPLFGEVPSANLGFSQTTQPEMFQHLDWNSVDLQSFSQE